MADGLYSLSDLCDLADVTARTVRYYIAQGLLRSPGTTGPGARYDDGHLSRLRLIRRLQREHLPLAEIRARLAALSDEEVIAEAEGPSEPPTGSALDYVREVLGTDASPSPTAALGRASSLPLARPMLAARDAAPVDQGDTTLPVRAAGAPTPVPPASGIEPTLAGRSHWERYVLAPDVELHVRRPLTRSQNRAVARLLEAASQILEEDRP